MIYVLGYEANEYDVDCSYNIMYHTDERILESFLEDAQKYFQEYEKLERGLLRNPKSGLEGNISEKSKEIQIAEINKNASEQAARMGTNKEEHYRRANDLKLLITTLRTEKNNLVLESDKIIRDFEEEHLKSIPEIFLKFIEEHGSKINNMYVTNYLKHFNEVVGKID